MPKYLDSRSREAGSWWPEAGNVAIFGQKWEAGSRGWTILGSQSASSIFDFGGLFFASIFTFSEMLEVKPEVLQFLDGNGKLEAN